MGHYGALWGVFKRDISKSIQANPIVPHNAPWLPPDISNWDIGVRGMGVRDMGDWDMGDQDMGARDMGDRDIGNWDISNWDIGVRGMHGCPGHG